MANRTEPDKSGTTNQGASDLRAMIGMLDRALALPFALDFRDSGRAAFYLRFKMSMNSSRLMDRDHRNRRSILFMITVYACERKKNRATVISAKPGIGRNFQASTKDKN